jgi:biopolymer transport protein TolQ
VQFSITETLSNAGPIGLFVLITLLLFSIISWSIVFMKARHFRRVRNESSDFLNEFWASSNLSEANNITNDFPFCPEAAVFSAGFNELQKINKIRTRKEASGKETLDMQLATIDNLQRAMRKAESVELTKIAKSLSFLATTGSSAPFIGLFGTVWGIMRSFHEIGQSGSASLSVVAPHISEALVATAAGLAVAIPAVVFYNHYSSKLDDVGGNIQNFITDLLNLVERDLLGRV